MFGKMDPSFTIWLNVLISLVTIVSFYWVGKKIFNTSIGLIASFLYGFSAMATNYDRILWNHTPIPLVSLGIYYYLFKFLDKRRLLDLLISSVLLGFMIHLHFQVLFVIFFFLFSLIYFGGRNVAKDLKVWIVIAVSIVIFIVPLLVFDFRHDFINFNHLIAFFFKSNRAGGGNILNNVVNISTIQLNFFREMLFRNSSLLTNTFSFGVFLSLIIGAYRKTKSEMSFVLLRNLCVSLILISTVLFSFYSGPLPSQYFLFMFPVYIFVWACSLNILKQSKFSLLFPIIILFFLITNIRPIWGNSDELSLEYKYRSVSYIVKDSNSKSFKVDFITDLGRKTGFQYLFWLQGKKLIDDMSVTTDKTYKIIIPYYLVNQNEIYRKFGGIGIVKVI